MIELAPIRHRSLRRSIMFSALLYGGIDGLLHAQTLEVTPTHIMADEAATIRATGLQPHERVSIHAELMDGADHLWASQAEFIADDGGSIDTAKQAPAKGSYKAVSAMGLVWSMMPTTKDAHSYRPPRGYGTQMISFHLVQNGKQTASAQLEQAFLREGVRQVKLTGALHGVLFLPDTSGPHTGVLVVGGSEGGLPAPRAAWLASHGYAALALAYFRYEGLPNELSAIPLEYFGQALAWMKERPEIAPGQLGVMGTSRGGELALQLGSMYSSIKAVVAYVPANVRYPSCCGRMMTVAWTWKGQGLAFVLPTSRGPVPQSNESLAATIRVEETHGPIMVLSGDDDGVWPSSSMTSAVVNRLKAAHFPYPYERLDYPHAGHRAGNPAIIPTWTGSMTQPLSGEPENLGGSPQGNAESSLDAIPRVLKFLEQAFPAVIPNIPSK
jgi:dienelactone hydrolase